MSLCINFPINSSDNPFFHLFPFYSCIHPSIHPVSSTDLPMYSIIYASICDDCAFPVYKAFHPSSPHSFIWLLWVSGFLLTHSFIYWFHPSNNPFIQNPSTYGVSISYLSDFLSSLFIHPSIMYYHVLFWLLVPSLFTVGLPIPLFINQFIYLLVPSVNPSTHPEPIHLWSLINPCLHWSAINFLYVLSPSIHPSIHPVCIDLSSQASFFLAMPLLSSIHPFTHPSFIILTTYSLFLFSWSANPSIHQSVYLYIGSYSSTHPEPIHQSISPSVWSLSIHPSIHPAP